MKNVAYARSAGNPMMILCLCAILFCFWGTTHNHTDAKVSDGITITQSSVTPSPAVVGQEMEFSAGFTSSPYTGLYKLHVCKTKKLSVSNSCSDGSWCDSASFAADNPLSCAYTATTAGENIGYYAFICDNLNRCSVPFSGSFSVVDRILDINAPDTMDFGIFPFSFSSQNSIGNSLGDLIITSNMNGATWSLDVTASDWTSSGGSLLDTDGDGATTGQLTVNLDNLSIDASDPPSILNITPGQTASFSPATPIINIVSAADTNTGIFVIKNISFDQFIPANQPEGYYAATVIFTIS
jgi:hypothetical protein